MAAMSNPALFAIGFVITMLVVFAVGGLVYAARLDGKYQQEMEARQQSSSEDQE